MTDGILTINAGSSTLKIGLFTSTPPVQAVSRQSLPPESAVEDILRTLPREINLKAIGHRVVHGGQAFTAPTVIDQQVYQQLHTLAPLAPLHLPPALTMIQALQAHIPEVPHVACFDTAFHHTTRWENRQLPLPAPYGDEGIIRYGFHGLSYEYIAGQLAPSAGPRVIVAHLGNGASACAMLKGKSVATSMGFSALDGMMMGSRTGSIDPGAIVHLQTHYGMSGPEISDLLYKKSGLIGVSGISSDMRVLSQSDAPAARRAVDLFCYRAAQEIAALIPAISGIDTLVFTGGIGENSVEVREKIHTHLAWLSHHSMVIATDEEAMIAQHTAHQIKGNTT